MRGHTGPQVADIGKHLVGVLVPKIEFIPGTAMLCVADASFPYGGKVLPRRGPERGVGILFEGKPGRLLGGTVGAHGNGLVKFAG